jgi:TP901 family phage tail tape measure protein
MAGNILSRIVEITISATDKTGQVLNSVSSSFSSIHSSANSAASSVVDMMQKVRAAGDTVSSSVSSSVSAMNTVAQNGISIIKKVEDAVQSADTKIQQFSRKVTSASKVQTPSASRSQADIVSEIEKAKSTYASFSKLGGSVSSDFLDAEFKKMRGSVQALNHELSRPVKYNITNTKSVTAEIKRIKQEFEALRSSGKATAEELSAAYRGTQASLQRLTAELAKPLRPMQGLFTTATSLQTLLAGMGAGYAIVTAIQQTKEFDDNLRAAGAAAGATSGDLARMEDAARKAGAETKFTAADAASALQILAMAGLTVDESIAALPNVLNLASAGMMDIASAADISTSILAGYQMKVSDLSRVNDVLAKTSASSNVEVSELGTSFKYAGPIAKSTGIEFEELATMLGLLANAGYKGSMAGTIMRNAIADLSKQTSAVSGRLREMGIEVKSATGGLRPMTDILEDLAKKGATTEDMLTLFGKRGGPGMSALLGMGISAIRSYREEINNSADAASRITGIMEGGLGGALRRVSSAYQEVQIAIERTSDQKLVDFLTLVQNSLLSSKKEIADFVGGVISIGISLASSAISVGSFVVEHSKLILVLGGVTTALYAIGAAIGVIEWSKTLTFVQILAKLNLSFVATSATNFFSVISTGFTGIVTLATTSLTAIGTFLTGFIASNPVLAAIAAVITVAAGAVLLFSDNAEKSAKRHQELANSIGESRKEIQGQIEELKNIKKVFDTAEEGSSAHIRAQESLAKAMKDSNVSIDDHGRVIAKVGDGYVDNYNKLKLYIDQLEKQDKTDFALQLEQQAIALKKSSDAIVEQRKRIEILTGGNGAGESKVDPFLKGAYENEIKKTYELAKAKREASAAMTDMVSQAVKAGWSVEELTSTLNQVNIEPKIRDEVIDKFKSLIKLQDAAIKQREAAAKVRKDVGIEPTEADVTSKMSDQDKAEYKILKDTLSDIDKAREKDVKKVTEYAGKIGKEYQTMAGLVKESSSTQIEAINTVTEARLAAVSVSGASELSKIQQETAINRQAYDAKAQVIREYISTSEELLSQEEELLQIPNKTISDIKKSETEILQNRREIFSKTKEESTKTADSVRNDTDKMLQGSKEISDAVTKSEYDMLLKRKSNYKEAATSYQTMITSMIGEEKKHLEAVRKAEEEKAALKLTVEDKVRSLRQQGMSEEMKYADIKKQIDEKQAAARQAIAAGEFTKGKQLAERAMALAESNTLKEKEGATRDDIAKVAEKNAEAAAAKAAGEYEKAKRLTEEAIKLSETNTKKQKEGVSQQQADASVSSAIKEVEESSSIIEDALNQTEKAHQKAADSIKAQKDSLSVSLREAQQEIEALNSKIEGISVANISVHQDGVKEAENSLVAVYKALTDLDGKIATVKVVEEKTQTESHFSGGVAGLARSIFKEIISPITLKKSGYMPGYSSSDVVSAYLAKGEGILNNTAMRHYEESGLARLNALQVPKQALYSNNVTSHTATSNNVSTVSNTTIRFDGLGLNANQVVKTKAEQLLAAVSGG